MYLVLNPLFAVVSVTEDPFTTMGYRDSFLYKLQSCTLDFLTLQYTVEKPIFVLPANFDTLSTASKTNALKPILSDPEFEGLAVSYTQFPRALLELHRKTHSFIMYSYDLVNRLLESTSLEDMSGTAFRSHNLDIGLKTRTLSFSTFMQIMYGIQVVNKHTLDPVIYELFNKIYTVNELHLMMTESIVATVKTLRSCCNKTANELNIYF